MMNVACGTTAHALRCVHKITACYDVQTFSGYALHSQYVGLNMPMHNLFCDSCRSLGDIRTIESLVISTFSQILAKLINRINGAVCYMCNIIRIIYGNWSRH